MTEHKGLTQKKSAPEIPNETGTTQLLHDCPHALSPITCTEASFSVTHSSTLLNSFQFGQCFPIQK